MRYKESKSAYLSGFAFDAIKDGLVGRGTKAAYQASSLVVLISRTQPFRAEIKSISEWLVDALQRIPAGHEDLSLRASQFHLALLESLSKGYVLRTRSKAVEHALGWVATKMGLADMVNYLMIDLIELIEAPLTAVAI